MKFLNILDAVFFYQLKRIKEKKMSEIECVFKEYKENCKIKGAIINNFRRPKEFKISIQCLEQNMDIYHERRRLFELCKKHGIYYISCPWDINFNISQIISIRPLYDSTFLFIFN